MVHVCRLVKDIIHIELFKNANIMHIFTKCRKRSSWLKERCRVLRFWRFIEGNLKNLRCNYEGDDQDLKKFLKVLIGRLTSPFLRDFFFLTIHSQVFIELYKTKSSYVSQKKTP